MALAESVRALSRGDGWGSAFGYLYLSQDEIDQARHTESRLSELNRRTFEAGKWTETQYLASQERLQSSTLTAMLESPDSSPWEGFKGGLAEGAKNVQDKIRAGLAAPINWAFGSIPWQLWAVAAVALIIYTGLWRQLLGKVK